MDEYLEYLAKNSKKHQQVVAQEDTLSVTAEPKNLLLI